MNPPVAADDLYSSDSSDSSTSSTNAQVSTDASASVSSSFFFSSLESATGSSFSSSAGEAAALDDDDADVEEGEDEFQPQQSVPVPLVLRLFEQLVHHSQHSETWRYLLQAVTEDLLGYLTGRSDSAASSLMEDPFYPGLVHQLQLTRTPAPAPDSSECLRWSIRVGSWRAVGLTLDSSESALVLAKCSEPASHLRHLLGDDAPSEGCCCIHCWPIASLGDFASCLDAAYRSSVHLCASRMELMRGKYHGCRRG